MILVADSKGPDQTVRMRRLIWAFAVRICPKTRLWYGAAYIKNDDLIEFVICLNDAWCLLALMQDLFVFYWWWFQQWLKRPDNQPFSTDDLGSWGPGFESV